MNKKEYIKQLKRLILKYHPDLYNDSYLKTFYNEITVKLVNKLNNIKSKEDIQNLSNKIESGLIKLKDQDYIFYKSGIKYYRNIHPNYFYKRDINTTFKTKTYEEMVMVLNKIYLSFNLSEYYFRRVIEEYPQSTYFEDAKIKIQLLKKLYKSYENLVLEENKIIDNGDFMDKMGLKIL